MKMLEEALPLFLWEEAEKQAVRSTLKNYRTGAVIFNGVNVITSKGCSHVPMSSPFLSIHAEYHALQEHYDYDYDSNILIVCLNRAGNYAYSARPCAACANEMYAANIKQVYYAERMNNEAWICNIETPAELVERTNNSFNSYRSFAKEMRIM